MRFRSEDQKKIYVAYVRNLYDILDRLRAKHPKLEIESCSGGGGRVDLGILRCTDEVWPSDNTDALDRLTLQDGFTQAYTPGIMMAWVTDVPSGIDHRVVPLKFRFLVAMSGSLGTGSEISTSIRPRICRRRLAMLRSTSVFAPRCNGERSIV